MAVLLFWFVLCYLIFDFLCNLCHSWYSLEEGFSYEFHF